MQKLLALFPAFENRNYRLYFVGQFVSLIGTWLQVVAESWLVLTLTNSVFLIGVVAACATLPTLFFSLFGGVIVDRFSKKKILLITQSLAMVLALIYGSLTVFHLINIWEIMVLALLLGVVTALDFPARQALTVELVDRKNLSSAIALNGGMFNGARVVGPGIAGILIAFLGPGGAFLINGVSYIAGIITTYMIDIHEPKKATQVHPIQAVKEGLSYTFSHPTIRSLILFTAVISIFGWSYATIVPYIAKNTLHINAAGLGYLYAVTGLGALVSTVIVSAFSKKFSDTTFIVGGTIIFCFAIFGFTFANSFLTAIPFLFITGIGLLSTFATINTSIQHSVEDSLRGRVLSIYVLAFFGLFPIGNFQIGWVADHVGPENAIRIGAIIVLVACVLYYLSRNSRGRKQGHYDKGREKQIPQAVLEQAEY